MKAQCAFDTFQKAVHVTHQVATKQASLPVLSGILIIAKEKTVVVRSTNLQVGFEITLPAEVEEEGVVVVDAQTMQRTTSTLQRKKKIRLQYIEGEGELAVEVDGSTMKMKTYPPDDFPTLPRITEGTILRVPVEKFSDAVRSVAYAASKSDIKPELSSVYIYPEGEYLTMVATDSFRLAERKVIIKNLPEFDGILIPVKNIQDLIRVFGDVEGELEITIGENQIMITVGSVFATSRIIDGSFPDYRQIIPKDSTTKATFLTQDIQQALRLVTVFSDRYNQIDLHISPTDKLCTLSSAHSDVGSTVTHLDAVLEGEALDMRINHTYLSDALSSISEDSIEVSCSGASRPIILRPVGSGLFTYLIMPMTR